MLHLPICLHHSLALEGCSRCRCVCSLHTGTVQPDPATALSLITPSTDGRVPWATGILEPSSGAVHVCGLDLFGSAASVALLVGICPQHDVLWPTLTGREHVTLFARIKVGALALACLPACRARHPGQGHKWAPGRRRQQASGGQLPDCHHGYTYQAHAICCTQCLARNCALGGRACFL